MAVYYKVQYKNLLEPSFIDAVKLMPVSPAKNLYLFIPVFYMATMAVSIIAMSGGLITIFFKLFALSNPKLTPSMPGVNYI